ncbi:MAG: hypothetical protein ACRET1_06710 [Burkholderiales bacterium]
MSDTLRNLLLPLAILVAIIAAGSILVSYTKDDLVTARRALVDQRAKLRAAQAQLRESDDERTIILQYRDRYAALYRKGFVGKEQRLNWIDALRQASHDAQLFSADYQIGVRQPYTTVHGQTRHASAPAAGAGQLAFYRSTMRLQMKLLHADDLLRFFDLLQQQGTGLFLIDSCNVDRIGDGSMRYQPNLSATCELSWITAEPAHGPDKPS